MHYVQPQPVIHQIMQNAIAICSRVPWLDNSIAVNS